MERSELLYVETRSTASVAPLPCSLNVCAYVGNEFLPEKTEMDLDKSSGGAKRFLLSYWGNPLNHMCAFFLKDHSMFVECKEVL